MMGVLLLAVPVLLPIVWGIGVLAAASGKEQAGEDRRFGILAEGTVILNSLITWWLILHRDGTEKLVLFKLYGNLAVSFKLDAMGSVFAGLVSFLWPLATLYALEYMKHEKRKRPFFAWYTMTYGVTLGIAFAGNLVTMYLFYEMLTLVTFPLVLFPMTREAMRASRKYLYYSIGGAAFAFIGLIFILNYSATGTTEFVPGGFLNLAAAESGRGTLLFVYVIAFFGFGVKAAIFPCHGWLPKATVAPTPVTALLHAVAVVKSGAFAILRFTYFCYGTEFLRGSSAQWVVMAAVMVTIVFGSTMAVKEVHWKRRLAYSTVSNLSYILLGAVMMSPLGLTAALCHLVFHAFMKICSFFCAGAVMHQTGKTYIYELDGLGKKMPVTFACLTVASLSLMGIPLFAGFISKWNIAQSAVSYGSQVLLAGSLWGWLPIAGVAVILYSALMTGVYMLTVLVRAYFPCLLNQNGGSGREMEPAYTDPNWMMLVPLVTFAAVILFFGLYSGPLVSFLTVIGGEAG